MNKVLARLLLAFAAALLLGGILLPQVAGWLQGRFSIPRGDILFHFGIFAVVFALLPAARWWRVRWWHLAVGALVLGAGTEMLQHVIPHREPSMVEVLADVLGAGLGALLGMTWLRRRRAGKVAFRRAALSRAASSRARLGA